MKIHGRRTFWQNSEIWHDSKFEIARELQNTPFIFSEQELEREGEMFRKRCGAGLSTAYCSFGLRKGARSWFTDSTGKSWLDLKTRTA